MFGDSQHFEPIFNILSNNTLSGFFLKYKCIPLNPFYFKWFKWSMHAIDAVITCAELHRFLVCIQNLAWMILWNRKMTVEIPVVLLQVTHFLSILATGGVLKPVTALQLTGAARGRVCNDAAGISQICLSHCTQTVVKHQRMYISVTT